MPNANDKPARNRSASEASTDPSSPAALRVARVASHMHAGGSPPPDAPLADRTLVERHGPAGADPGSGNKTGVGTPGEPEPAPRSIDLDSSDADDVLLEGLLWRRPDRVVDTSQSAGHPAAVHHAVHDLLPGDRTPTPQPKVLIARAAPDLDATVRTRGVVPSVAGPGNSTRQLRHPHEARKPGANLFMLAAVIALGLLVIVGILASAERQVSSPAAGPSSAPGEAIVHSAPASPSRTPLPSLAPPTTEATLPTSRLPPAPPAPSGRSPPTQPPLGLSHRPSPNPVPPQSHTAPALSHPLKPVPASDDPDFLRE